MSMEGMCAAYGCGLLSGTHDSQRNEDGHEFVPAVPLRCESCAGLGSDCYGGRCKGCGGSGHGRGRR